ncbi:MAG: HNH endonuclease [Rhizobacter sp.]|nr:HNH endonuclease [Rhizobacter sp.]
MPQAAPRPCTQAGCGVLVRDGSGRCGKHKLASWSVRCTPTKRMTGRRLQRAREQLFKRQPTCEECERHDRVSLATVRDHRVPLAEGGADDPSNEQALCDACHDAKSLAERLRGRGR